MSRQDTGATTDGVRPAACRADGADLPHDHLQKLAGDFLIRISAAVAEGTLSAQEARELHQRVRILADDRE